MPSEVASVPTLKLQRLVPAAPERIYDLWTRPELMVKWMSPYKGRVNCVAEADVRAGGQYKLSMTTEGGMCDITGSYVEVDRPRKLVFTWTGPPTDHANSLVTVLLKPIREMTELTLLHEKLPTAEIRAGHLIGWENMFGHLELWTASAG